MNFWVLNSTNSISEVNIYKKDNSNLNEKLPELKNLNDFTFQFTKELQNNQDKQEKIRNLITTYGQKIKENSTYKTWVINKKITIKAQGTDLYNFKDFFDKTNYRLNETNNFEIEIEKDSTDIDLPITTTKFDGNHKYDDIIDNLDYLIDFLQN
ncbi:hypothetical protein [Spiroplasma endosymbiont of Clivina fossor]|uniref:hypothetical protein n=1 Tax=Spiroplasma endosymbiont of Clivina fossor TaxID=3066282 RepID=UPI00313C8AAF